MTDFVAKSLFVQTLQKRGYINQCTDLSGLDEVAAKGGLTGYVGFDATADSLHVGNLVSLMMLHILAKTDGIPIALLGTGTSMVGDPSDKNATRPMLTNDAVSSNGGGIIRCIKSVLQNAKIVENGDWLHPLKYIEFLREVGPHFTINRMVTMDFVRNRLENNLPLSFLEFNYILLQSYDFAQLFKNHGCVLQMGGSDQWGNIVNGIDLGRRLYGANLFGLTTNLITTSSGNKMGKTAEGKAIWLLPEKTSPYDYFQFWRNVEDADVFRFLRLFTEMPIALIETMHEKFSQGLLSINLVKECLAFEATSILHGQVAAQSALQTARALFSGEGASVEGLPTIPFKDGMTVFEAVLGLGLASSKNEVRRLCAQGGIKLNGAGPFNGGTADATLLIQGETVLTKANFADGVIRVSVGKKKHGIVEEKIGA